MQKRAQVTVFILLGLVIAILIFLSFYFFGSKLTQQDKTPLDRTQLIPLQQHIENCMQVSLEKSFDALKSNAFYSSTSAHYTEYGGANINYLIYPENSQNKLPSLQGIQEVIASQLVQDMKTCALSKFKLNIKEDKSNIKASAAISDSKIILTLNYPIKITKGKTTLQLQDFSITKDTDLGLIHTTISEIISGELSGEFDQYQYSLTHPEAVIDKFNLNMNNALFLVTSNKGEDYVLFAIKK